MSGCGGIETTDDAFLGGALRILQPARGFRAGLDAVLLAAAVPRLEPAAGRHCRVLDAGAGVGVAGLSLARRAMAQASVVLVERVPELVGLAEANITRNGLSGSVRVVAADVCGAAAQHVALGLEPDGFDVVMANPPYDEAGAGRASADPIKAQANAMAAGELEQWLRFLVRMAVPGGQLVMIHRADALPRLLAALDGRFGAIEVLPVHPRAGRPAHRVLVRARKGSQAKLTLHDGIALHEAAGNGFVPEIDAILRHGAALAWPQGGS